MTLLRACAPWLAVLSLGSLSAAQTQPTSGPALRTIEGRYYVIHTDLPPDQAREADLRMTAMAEEYRARTKDFAGEITEKFPFYLFTREPDYLAAGGKPDSAGVFLSDSNKLMAFAGEGEDVWHTVQHEGFHQYAVSVIGELPIWLNEGLADYFGEALFTGDGFVAGIVPEWRRERIVRALRRGAFMPTGALMRLSHKQWNAALKLENYDQAWSIVHFLVHADGGQAYRGRFADYIRAVSRGKDPERAWIASIGPIDSFEREWRTFWVKLPPQPSIDLYAEATVRTLTSFLARAAAGGRRFTSMKELTDAVKRGDEITPDDQWLPPVLLSQALAAAQRLTREGRGKFSIEAARGKDPRVRYVAQDGRQTVGRFTLREGRVEKIDAGPP